MRDFFRDMDRISEKASDFEEILRELQNVVDGRASASIRQVLQKVSRVLHFSRCETHSDVFIAFCGYHKAAARAA